VGSAAGAAAASRLSRAVRGFYVPHRGIVTAAG